MMEAWFSSSDKTASCGASRAWKKTVGVELLPNHLGSSPSPCLCESKFHCHPGHSSGQGDPEPLSASIWVTRAPGPGLDQGPAPVRAGENMFGEYLVPAISGFPAAGVGYLPSALEAGPLQVPGFLWEHLHGPTLASIRKRQWSL